MKDHGKTAVVFISIIILIVAVLAVLNYLFPGKKYISYEEGSNSITLHIQDFTRSFNYYINNASDAYQVFSLVYDSLLDMDPETLEFRPLIAKSWEISADKKTFTFHIDPRARWADGQPITAEDVKFTYDTIMNKNNLTSVQRLFMSRFLPPAVIDPLTISFTAINVHYLNFINLAEFNIIPEHLFKGRDFNRNFNFTLPPGSGPYQLDQVEDGRYYILKRNRNYWADVLPNRKGMFNFDRIIFKVIHGDSDNRIAYEAFKKGDFDIFYGGDISSKRWVRETDSEAFLKGWLMKKKVYNYAPQGFMGISINESDPVLRDIRVREGLCLLLDRKTMIEKIMYGQVVPITSYWPSLYKFGEGNPVIPYDPVLAKKLFIEAGFDRLDNDGVLVNERGQRLEFTIIYAHEDLEKELSVFQECCSRAGVKIILKRLSWATLIKHLDDYDFQMVQIGWTASLFDDPEQLWHSKHIGEPGGSNLSSFTNREVDELIDSLAPVFNTGERNGIIRRIDSIIYNNYPYILFWNMNYQRIIYKNIFDMPETVFTRYGDISDAISYWKINPVKLKAYEDARKSGESLPLEKVDVYYDNKISGQ